MARGNTKTWLTAPFQFTSGPVTILTAVVYLVILIGILVTDELSDIPEDRGGFDLSVAYDDLHKITTRPHPFLSHANDDVHAYILSRLHSIAARHPYIHVTADLSTNISYIEPGIVSLASADRNVGQYFEGTNVLVKIDGTNVDESSLNETTGVLFSAHYDSAVASPGATDDGIAVVTLLQMVQYLAQPTRRPKRTAIFLINNAEENGLKGSRAYLEHPWAQLASTFINLEGAASGGRPIVFRSTSYKPVRAFRKGNVAHPHGSAIGADAFAQGVIRSRTDYQIYAKGLEGQVNGMSGVDLAFYQHRSFYHTMRDSIPAMGRGEGLRAMWSMMENTRGAGLSLLNDDDLGGDDVPAVYLDLLGRTFLVFPLQTMFITNIVLLTAGPIIIMVLLTWVIITSNKYTKRPAAGHTSGVGNTWLKLRGILSVLLGWGRFWIALLVVTAANGALVVGYVKLNTFTIHSHQYLVLLTFLTLSYLSFVTPLALFQSAVASQSSIQKAAIILEVYLLTWVILLVSTIAISRWGLGGVYPFTAWNICALLGCIAALIEAAVRARRGAGGRIVLDLGAGDPGTNGAERRLVPGVMYEAPEESAEADEEPREEVMTAPTEITPLIRQARRPSKTLDGVDADAGKSEAGWWIVQMLLTVPLPVLLFGQVALLLSNSVSQTLTDGSSPVLAYAGVAFLSLLMMLPVTPFAHKQQLGFVAAMWIVFALSLGYSWLAFPFTQESPMKLFFLQEIEVSALGSSAGGAGADEAIFSVGPRDAIRAVTSLTGLSGYLDRMVIPELPSSWNRDVSCVMNERTPGLTTCKWDSDLIPSPGGNRSSVTSVAASAQLGDNPLVQNLTWIDLRSKRTNATHAQISVKGRNTRGCRIEFDRAVDFYHVHGGPHTYQAGYGMPDGGIKELQLWSRTWDRDFTVDFSWGQSSTSEWDDLGGMTGRVLCSWVEHASGTAGSTSESGGQIPAFEELRQFLPLWVLGMGYGNGLVDVWTRFSV